MSAEASGYVWSQSTYTGVAFTIHLAMADVVNDQHGNEFFMSSTNLAAKARTTASTARRILGEMVDNGDLEVVDRPVGRPTRYRFVMGGVSREHTPPVSREHTPVSREHRGCIERTQGVYRENTHNSIEPKLNEKRTPRAAFDDFWAVYPRKLARRGAKEIWETLDPGDRVAAVAAARHWAECFEQAASFGAPIAGLTRFTPYPATWLSTLRWEDPADDVAAFYAGLVPEVFRRPHAAPESMTEIWGPDGS